MKKMKAAPQTARRVKAIAAAAMAVTLAVPTVSYFAQQAPKANAEEALPQAVLTVDFEQGFSGEKEENGLSVVKSEALLLCKEKMEADGKTYIYNDDKSKVYDITDVPFIESGYYKYGVSGNQPTTKSDSEKGNVLMFRETVHVAEATKQALDADKQESNADIDEKYPLGCVLQYSTVAESQVTINNPFTGKDLSKGASVSYWVKTPAGEDGKGQNSSLIVFGVKEEDNVKVSSTLAGGVYNTEKDAEKEAEAKLSIQLTANNDFHYVADGKDAFAYTGDGKVLENGNTWAYVTVSMTDSEVVTYVNGVETNRQAVTTAGLTDALKDEGTGVFFGGNYSTAAEAVGQNVGTVNDVCLDDVAFYTQAITPEEAGQLYNVAKTKMETVETPVVIETFDFENGLTGSNGTTISGVDSNKTNPEVVTDAQKGNVLKMGSGTPSKTAAAILSANPFAGKSLEGATINYWVKETPNEKTGAVNPSISMSFIDTPKSMKYEKVNETKQGDSRTVLYTKTDMDARFEEGYTTNAYEDLKNYYQFSTTKNTHTDASTDANGQIKDKFYDPEAADLQKAYQERLSTMSEWHMITAVFTNAGIQMYYDGEPLSNNQAEAYDFLDSTKTTCRPTSAGPRFYDGYYKTVFDGYAQWHRASNNQGAKPLMTFLTDTTTSAYIGYMYSKGGDIKYERTYEAYYDDITYYATALTAQQVYELKNGTPELPPAPDTDTDGSTSDGTTNTPSIDANQGSQSSSGLNVSEDGNLYAEAGGVKVEMPAGVLPEGVELVMGTLGTQSDAAAYESFNTVLAGVKDFEILADENGAKKYIIYTVTPSDASVTPNGTYKLSLTIPDGFDTGALIVIDENGKMYDVTISQDGKTATIEGVDHFGKFALVVKNMSQDDESTVAPKAAYSGKTGDTANVVMPIVVLVAAGAAFVVASKKRRIEE